MMTRAEDDKILLQTITQMDFKMKISASMISMALSKPVKTWYDNVVKYYTSNNKKI